MSKTAKDKQTIAYAKIEIFVIFLISVILLTSYLVIDFIGISYSEKKKSNFNKRKYYKKFTFLSNHRKGSFTNLIII